MSAQDRFHKLLPQLLLKVERALSSSILIPSQRAGLTSWINSDRSFDSFQKNVPPVSKVDLFDNHEWLSSLLKSSSHSKKIIPSAGTSGKTLAFRLYSKTADQAVIQGIRVLMQMWGLDPAETLIVNCYPTGVQIPEGVNSIEVGARPEILKLCLKKFNGIYQSFIVCGQPHFLKVLADGRQLQGVHANSLRFIIGGEWMSPSFSRYIGEIVGLSEAEIIQNIATTYGLSELGLGIGFHLPDAAKKRSASGKMAITFSYDPNSFFVESLNGELLITPMNDEFAFRYATGDRVELKQEDGTFDLFGRLGVNQDDNQRAQLVNEKLCHFPELFRQLNPEFHLQGNCIAFRTSDLKSYDTLLPQLLKLFPENQVSLEIASPDPLRKVVHSG